MGEKKSYTIHKSKENQMDRMLTARPGLRKNLEKTSHRVDSIGEIDGVEFICDTRAVDLLATRDTFRYIGKPMVWLAATIPHERDYSLLQKYVKRKVKSIVACGKNAEDMRSKLERFVDRFATAETLEEAMKAGLKYAEKGDCVVYSPSCAPQDDYVNFSDRGKAFKRAFEELKNK